MSTIPVAGAGSRAALTTTEDLDPGTTVVRVQPPQPQPASSPVPVAPPKRPNRRLRLWLAMGLGLLVLLCAGGIGVFVSLYDGATAIKRTAPDAVVDNFLGAYLVNRDDNEASLYQCKAGGDFAAIQAYRADITTREKASTVGIRVSWGSLAVAVSGDRGTVTTDLTKVAGDEHLTKTWQFAVVDQDGWRVCGATQLP
jgi:hypothetical protein